MFNLAKNTGSTNTIHVGMQKKQNIFTDINRNAFCYILALPAILYTFVFGYMTYPYIIVAFQRFDYRKGIFHSEWIGFKNFDFFLSSNNAAIVTWNTLKLNFLFIVFGTLFAVLLALVLNELKNKVFLKISQSVMLLPNYLSWVAVSFMLFSIFSFNKGLLNQLLNFVGSKPINWYASAEPWPAILTGMKLWKEAGMTAVIYLASIVGIDNSLYESAQIDGANRWQQVRSITLPLLMPTIAILTLLSVGRIMYGDFGMIYALIGDNGVLYPTTDVIDTYVFRALRKIGDPGEAMAIGLFQSIIGFVMVFGFNRLARRFFKEGAIY